MRPNMIKNAHDLIFDMEKNFTDINNQSKNIGEKFQNFLDEVFKDSYPY